MRLKSRFFFQMSQDETERVKRRSRSPVFITKEDESSENQNVENPNYLKTIPHGFLKETQNQKIKSGFEENFHKILVASNLTQGPSA